MINVTSACGMAFWCATEYSLESTYSTVPGKVLHEYSVVRSNVTSRKTENTAPSGQFAINNITSMTSDRYNGLSCILVLEEIGENISKIVTFPTKDDTFRRSQIVLEEIVTLQQNMYVRFAVFTEITRTLQILAKLLINLAIIKVIFNHS